MKTYSSGQFSEVSGLSRKALRLYEDLGLLSPMRADNGYRVYSESDVRDAHVIADLRAAGLSLVDIQTLFAVKQSVASPSEKLREVATLLTAIRQTLLEQQMALVRALETVDEAQTDIQQALEEMEHDRVVGDDID